MRSGYFGFRATIKLVGTGQLGSRDLTFDEARIAMAALLANETSEVQAGAPLEANTPQQHRPTSPAPCSPERRTARLSGASR